MLTYTVPQDAQAVVAAVDPLDLGGEDVSMAKGTLGVSPSGDWATVRGREAARQSVVREFAANPNSFVHRPEWGIGASGQLFKGATPGNRDQIVSTAKARLRVNPRITRVGEVSGVATNDGLSFTIRAESSNGPIQETIK